MTTNASFVGLPECLINSICWEWLELDAVSILDTSFCCKTGCRQIILNSFKTVILKSFSAGLISMIDLDMAMYSSCLRWIALRDIKFEFFPKINYQHFELISRITINWTKVVSLDLYFDDFKCCSYNKRIMRNSEINFGHIINSCPSLTALSAYICSDSIFDHCENDRLATLKQLVIDSHPDEFELPTAIRVVSELCNQLVTFHCKYQLNCDEICAIVTNNPSLALLQFNLVWENILFNENEPLTDILEFLAVNCKNIQRLGIEGAIPSPAMFDDNLCTAIGKVLNNCRSTLVHFQLEYIMTFEILEHNVEKTKIWNKLLLEVCCLLNTRFAASILSNIPNLNHLILVSLDHTCINDLQDEPLLTQIKQTAATQLKRISTTSIALSALEQLQYCCANLQSINITNISEENLEILRQKYSKITWSNDKVRSNPHYM